MARARGEDKEERKIRKGLARAGKNARRVEKKETKLAFKCAPFINVYVFI